MKSEERRKEGEAGRGDETSSQYIIKLNKMLMTLDIEGTVSFALLFSRLFLFSASHSSSLSLTFFVSLSKHECLRRTQTVVMSITIEKQN